MKRIETTCLAGLVTVLAVASGCTDPVRSREQDRLGPEQAGVPRGPEHRPGQPCLVCHDGGEGPEFSVAGTLFVERDTRTPLVGGIVDLTDAHGAVYRLQANCVGNFWTTPKDFSPAYPVRVSIEYGGVSIPMDSLVHREGSCAACHSDPPGPASAGHVFLTDLPNPPEVPRCR